MARRIREAESLLPDRVTYQGQQEQTPPDATSAPDGKRVEVDRRHP